MGDTMQHIDLLGEIFHRHAQMSTRFYPLGASLTSNIFFLIIRIRGRNVNSQFLKKTQSARYVPHSRFHVISSRRKSTRRHKREIFQVFPGASSHFLRLQDKLPPFCMAIHALKKIFTIFLKRHFIPDMIML